MRVGPHPHAPRLVSLRSLAAAAGAIHYYNASAPETTSMISLVIAAWRTLFMYSVN